MTTLYQDENIIIEKREAEVYEGGTTMMIADKEFTIAPGYSIVFVANNTKGGVLVSDSHLFRNRGNYARGKR